MMAGLADAGAGSQPGYAAGVAVSQFDGCMIDISAW
jgi:hypothetical protein